MSKILPARVNFLQSGLRNAPYALLTVGLAFIIHALVLYFVFPRYYDPLWPNHDDFYVPMSLAHSSLSAWSYLWFPRPVGQLFFFTIGHLSLHGSIFVVLLLIMLNCTLASEIIRCTAKLPANFSYLASYSLYLFLLFSQPHFYEFAIHDAFAQLSFFLLTSSALLFLEFHKTGKTALLAISLVIAIAGFLAKETYGLTLVFLGFSWLIFHRREGLLRASLPLALTSIALAFALAFNFLQKSPFTSGASGSNNPYHLVVSPASVATEWLRYARDGLNALSISSLTICLCSSLIFLPKKIRWLSVILPLSAILAWVPNALLPNHHYSGYSWSGAYLLFSPALFISALVRRGWKPAACGLAAIITALTSPLLFARAYKDNDWSILQESNQRNLLKSLATLDAGLIEKPNINKVLVTGINFPFSPFGQSRAIRMFPHMRKIKFTVVSYSDELRAPAKERARFVATDAAIRPSGVSQASTDELVRFIEPGAVQVSDYQAIWAFEPDGKLASSTIDPANIPAIFHGSVGLDPSRLIIYPKLLDVFGDEKQSKPDGYTYLKCGVVLLSYGDTPDAETCLKFSTDAIPSNPYPFFYLGEAQAKQGKDCIALQSFRRAVTLDDPKAPNPYFKSALETVSCATTPSVDSAR